MTVDTYFTRRLRATHGLDNADSMPAPLLGHNSAHDVLSDVLTHLNNSPPKHLHGQGDRPPEYTKLAVMEERCDELRALTPDAWIHVEGADLIAYANSPLPCERCGQSPEVFPQRYRWAIRCGCRSLMQSARLRWLAVALWNGLSSVTTPPPAALRLPDRLRAPNAELGLLKARVSRDYHHLATWRHLKAMSKELPTDIVELELSFAGYCLAKHLQRCAIRHLQPGQRTSAALPIPAHVNVLRHYRITPENYVDYASDADAPQDAPFAGMDDIREHAHLAAG